MNTNDIISEILKDYKCKMEKDLKIYIPEDVDCETFPEYLEVYHELEYILKYKCVDVLYFNIMASVVYFYFQDQQDYIFLKLTEVEEECFDIYKVFVKTIKEIIDYSKIDSECWAGADNE